MLKIAGTAPPPPQAGPAGAPPLPDQMAAASGPKMLPMVPDPKTGSMGKYDAEKVRPETARYLSSDEGPFLCARCHHYLGDSCEIVAGPIDPEGVCCLFESGGQDVQPQDEGDVPTDEPDDQAGAPPQGLNPLG